MKTVKSILGQIILIGLLLIAILTDYLNPIKEYLPAMWTLMIIWSIFYSIKYRKGNVLNELRFSTNNDDYNKIYPYIMGTLLLTGGICALFFWKEYLIFTSLMALNGLLLIISGIVFIPNGAIRIKNNELVSVNGNQKNNVQIEKLNEVNLFQDRIVFIDRTDKKYNLEYLKLELTDFSRISDFINGKLDKKVEIKTYGNNGYNQ